MTQVIFVCKTCEHKNRMETGVDGYQQRQTRYESLTDAWLHLYETHTSKWDSAHEIVPELEN